MFMSFYQAHDCDYQSLLNNILKTTRWQRCTRILFDLAHLRSGYLCTSHTYFQIKESLPSAFLSPISLLWSVSKFHYQHKCKSQTPHPHHWNFWKSATVIDLQKRLAVREVCSGKDLQFFFSCAESQSSKTRILGVCWTFWPALYRLWYGATILHTQNLKNYSGFVMPHNKWSTLLSKRALARWSSLLTCSTLSV